MVPLDNGFKVIDHFLDRNQLDRVIAELDAINVFDHVAGIRNAEKKFQSVSELSHSLQLQSLFFPYLGEKINLVRVILFDKTIDNNWLVTWHQDKTIAVSSRFNKQGWGPWSIKEGIHHVQTPLEVLEKTMTCRIHLDDTNEDNGCLRVIPNSHRRGILSAYEIQKQQQTKEYVDCQCKAGSALLMYPHLLHASSKAKIPSSRRVLHIEYSAYSLPDGVEWS